MVAVLKIDMATRVQILDATMYISHTTNMQEERCESNYFSINNG